MAIGAAYLLLAYIVPNAPRAIESGRIDCKAWYSSIDVVRKNLALTGVDERDAAVIRFGRQLFHDNKVDSATFAKAAQLGFADQATIVLVNARLNTEAELSARRAEQSGVAAATVVRPAPPGPVTRTVRMGFRPSGRTRRASSGRPGPGR